MFPVTKTVLIVDDSLTARSMMKKHLEKIGFKNFLEAGSGNTGLKILSENLDITLVFSDVTMPDGNGIEFLSNVKKEPKLSQIPFIMVTSEGMEETITEAVLLGVNGYVIKPATVENIQETLNSIYKDVQAA